MPSRWRARQRHLLESERPQALLQPGSHHRRIVSACDSEHGSFRVAVGRTTAAAASVTGRRHPLQANGCAWGTTLARISASAYAGELAASAIALRCRRICNSLALARRSPMTPASDANTCPCSPTRSSSWLRPSAGQTFVDGTLGGGGHTRLLARSGRRRRDRSSRSTAIRRPSNVADSELRGLPVRALHANYSDLPEVLAATGRRRGGRHSARPGFVERSTGRRESRLQFSQRRHRSTCGSIRRAASRRGSWSSG